MDSNRCCKPRKTWSGRFVALLGLSGFLLGIASLQAAVNRDTEIGVPQFHIHTTQSIGTKHGSRFVSQDPNGRILFSANGELSAFDGSQWTRVSVPKRRSNEDMTVAKLGPNNEIYVGGLAYWGKLSVDEKGRYFTELFCTEAEQYEYSLESFTQIAFNDGKAYYKGKNVLVEWSPESGSKIWRHENIDLVFTHQNTLYLTSANRLETLVDGEIRPALEGDAFPPGSRTMQSVRWFDGRTALFNNEQGLVLFDGRSLVDIPDDLIPDKRIVWAHDMAAFDSNTIVITIDDLGFCFVGPKGEIKLKLDERLDPRFLDSSDIEIAPDNSIWVAVSDGVAQVLSPFPISHLAVHLDFALNYFDLARLGDSLLIRNNGYLQRAVYSEDGSFMHFRELPLFENEAITEIAQFEQDIIVATQHAVYRVSPDESSALIAQIPNVSNLLLLKHSNGKRLALATDDRFYLFEYRDGQFSEISALPIPAPADKILDDAAGNLWLEMGISRIGRIYEENSSYQFHEYGPEDGLTSDQWIPISPFGKEVLFSSRKGLLRYDPSEDRFSVAREINALIPEPYRQVGRIALAPNGDIWVTSAEGNMVLRLQDDGSYQVDRKTLQYVERFQIDNILFDSPDTTWLLSQKSLVRVDNTIPSYATDVPRPKLTSITDSRTGELLYHFERPDLSFPSKLAFDQNSLLLSLNTPNYQSIGGISYSYRLRGYSDQWSEPNRSATIALDRIPTGSHQLEIRAISNETARSPVASITLNVAPPWHSTWLAYLGYATLLLGGLNVFTKTRHRKLTSKQRKLEDKVTLQTKELREKNDQLRSAYLNERELKKEAQRASDAKSDFLATVSHEIRTPMNCIIGMSDILLTTPLMPEQEEMLRAINSSGHSLVAIISDILDFSKIEAGKIQLDETVFSSRQAVKDVFTLFLPTCREKGLTLRLQNVESIPELIVGDSIRLKQVLINLVGNAFKFTDAGSITITAKHQQTASDKTTLYFSVKDTGLGIKAEHMDKLFKAFSQVDSTDTRRFGGTGLGLAISKRLVGLMQGNISVYSEEGKGSEFSFSISVKLPTRAEVERFHRQQKEPRKQSAKLGLSNPYFTQPLPALPRVADATESDEPKDILIVEDNAINQQVTAMLLRRLGYTCDIADNGKIALEILDRKTYQAILMDIQMPEMDGLECTRRIRRTLGRKAPPIIAVTAGSSDVDKSSAELAGMCGYLTKPLERLKLKKLLETEIATADVLRNASRD